MQEPQSDQLSRTVVTVLLLTLISLALCWVSAIVR